MSAHNLLYELTQMKLPTVAEQALLKLDDGNVLVAYGTTVPSDATAGYSPACLFLHIDGGDATALYVNKGTAASCDFNAVTVVE